MKVKFILEMEELVLNGQQIKRVIIEWIEDKTAEEVLQISHNWMTSKFFLTSKINGLKQVGESSLVIQPITEEEKNN